VRFKEAAEAYAVLSDADQRERYDRFGHQGVGAGGFDPSVFADFSDILGDIFGLGDLFGGRRRRGSGAAPGADLRYDLVLSFGDAAFGTEAKLEIPRLETCEDCAGTGSAGRSAPAVCPACGGHGQVRYSQGFLTVARTCPQCGGEGRVVRDPCPACRGEGRRERRRTIAVKVPAGVDTGARLRLSGEGEHGRRGGRTGDLYVVLHVEPDARFERHGADVLGLVEVSYPQAVLGATVEVETLHGPAPLAVPAGTGFGEEFRLRGKGIPRLDGRGRGDHVARVALRVPAPKELSAEELALLRQLAELEGKPVRPGRKGLGKVKDLFG
jgi:molecular chaperone DnaJ